jgi:hypothetical protein
MFKYAPSLAAVRSRMLVHIPAFEREKAETVEEAVGWIYFASAALINV